MLAIVEPNQRALCHVLRRFEDCNYFSSMSGVTVTYLPRRLDKDSGCVYYRSNSNLIGALLIAVQEKRDGVEYSFEPGVVRIPSFDVHFLLFFTCWILSYVHRMSSPVLASSSVSSSSG